MLFKTNKNCLVIFKKMSKFQLSVLLLCPFRVFLFLVHQNFFFEQQILGSPSEKLRSNYPPSVQCVFCFLYKDQGPSCHKKRGVRGTFSLYIQNIWYRLGDQGGYIGSSRLNNLHFLPAGPIGTYFMLQKKKSITLRALKKFNILLAVLPIRI